METSIIVASYNQPISLGLGLSSLLMQDDLGFEVIVADDGSTPDVSEMVAGFAKTAPFPVKFVTHEDDGFRKPTIVNLAVLQALGKKIIFIDGDCLAFKNHVSMHVNNLAPGRFCVGGRVMLSLDDSLRLTREDVLAGNHKKFLTKEALKPMVQKQRTSWLQSLLGMNRGPRIIGCNFSIMREDFFTVNGYDETFNNQGKEDSDLRNRLRNNGFKGVNLLAKNIVCHLDHAVDKKSQHSGNKRVKDNSYYIERKTALTAAKGLKELLCQTK